MEEQATPALEREVPGYAEIENQTIPYGCDAFCSRHSRPVHRADLVSGVHRRGTPVIIDTAWTGRSSRNSPGPVHAIRHRQICCCQRRSGRCTSLQNYDDSYCRCFDVSDILLWTPATVAVTAEGIVWELPRPPRGVVGDLREPVRRMRETAGRAAGSPSATARFISGMYTMNRVKFGGDHTGVGHPEPVPPAATGVLCR